MYNSKLSLYKVLDIDELFKIHPNLIDFSDDFYTRLSLYNKAQESVNSKYQKKDEIIYPITLENDAIVYDPDAIGDRLPGYGNSTAIEAKPSLFGFTDIDYALSKRLEDFSIYTRLQLYNIALQILANLYNGISSDEYSISTMSPQTIFTELEELYLDAYVILNLNNIISFTQPEFMLDSYPTLKLIDNSSIRTTLTLDAYVTFSTSGGISSNNNYELLLDSYPVFILGTLSHQEEEFMFDIYTELTVS